MLLRQIAEARCTQVVNPNTLHLQVDKKHFLSGYFG